MDGLITLGLFILIVVVVAVVGVRLVCSWPHASTA